MVLTMLLGLFAGDMSAEQQLVAAGVSPFSWAQHGSSAGQRRLRNSLHRYVVWEARPNYLLIHITNLVARQCASQQVSA